MPMSALITGASVLSNRVYATTERVAEFVHSPHQMN